MGMMAIQLIIGLGGMLLQMMFTPKPKDQWGSRLSNINVPPVMPGNVVPRLWGTMKLPATMVFASPLIETMHTHEQSGGKKGGKGGGKGIFGGHSAKTYSFTYAIDGAWALCTGPVYRVNRIWANQKLLYVDPVVKSTAQATFDAAYQAEATRLIDEEGVDLDHAACSAFVFAWNNYTIEEATLDTPSQAVDYIMGHPIDDTGPYSLHNAILTPDRTQCNIIIGEMFSALNNQNTYLSNINRFDLVEIYLGTDGQGPNGLLAGYLGQGNVPAFRNCCYFVLTNLQLGDFGNSVPTFTAEVMKTPSGKTNLQQILTDLCYQTGLSEGDFDALSNVSPEEFPGFAITANQSARECVGELQKLFPIDAAETGYKIVFNTLNTRATQVVDERDLAAHQDDDPVPTRKEVTIASDYDLPQRINIRFQEPARAFSPNALYAARYNTPSQVIEDYDVTIALERNRAQKAVQDMLGYRMLMRRQYKWMMPRKYITIEPTDAFRIKNQVDPDRFDQFYCTQVHVGANGLLEVHAVDHAYLDPALAPDDQVADDLLSATAGNTDMPKTSQTVYFMLDLPLLTDDEPDYPGFYVMLAGAFNGWGGGNLYVNAASPSIATAYGKSSITQTAGAQWQGIASANMNVTHGVVLNVLASGMHAGYWDRKSVLTVRVSNGMTINSANEEDMLSTPFNVTMIGKELVQFASAEDLGNGVYRLKNFLRGLRGTERFMESHTVGEKFVRIATSLNRVITSKSEIGVLDEFRVVSSGQDLSTAQEFTFKNTGASNKPLEPYVFRTDRAEGGDVSFQWWPRVRQGGSWTSGADVTLPKNDTPETYEIDVCRTADPSDVAKTYTLTGADVALGGKFVYTTAQQTTDLGAPADTVHFAIYQISQIVGRGFGIGVSV